jgi:hypothetical protein
MRVIWFVFKWRDREMQATSSENIKIYLDYSEEVLKVIRQRNIPVDALLRKALQQENIECVFSDEETEGQTKAIRKALTISGSIVASAAFLAVVSQTISSIKIADMRLECVATNPKTGEVLLDKDGHPITFNQPIEIKVAVPNVIEFKIQRSCDSTK